MVEPFKRFEEWWAKCQETPPKTLAPDAVKKGLKAWAEQGFWFGYQSGLDDAKKFKSKET